ncbi:hypothetical protein ACFQZI_10545 [Mucilaginibacter lutimaris]|uniref:PepSY-associated TM region n=1 Tax=Mucilaginibacter lutimaris TaxID=931629 RepID=A0ABW2ZGH8_9SPHI
MQKTVTSLFQRLYFPGMISLICLPLFCIGYFAYKTGFKQLAAMDIAYADKDYLKKIKFDAASFEKNTPNLIFTNNEVSNKSRLKDLYKRCNLLLKHPRTSQGVTVVFENSSRYSDLVDVFDMGYRFKYRISFMPYNNKVYFLLPKSFLQKDGKASSAPKFWFCGTGDFINDYHPEQTFYSRSVAFLVRFWPPMIAFILMIFFASRKNRSLAV